MRMRKLQSHKYKIDDEVILSFPASPQQWEAKIVNIINKNGENWYEVLITDYNWVTGDCFYDHTYNIAEDCIKYTLEWLQNKRLREITG